MLRLAQGAFSMTFLRGSILACAMVCVFALAGCGDDEYKGMRRSNATVESRPALGASAPPLSGAEAVFGAGNVPKDTASAFGAGGPVSEPNAEEQRIARGDIYFKLAWVKQMLDSGSVPPGIGEALGEVRKRTAKLAPDDNRQKIEEITEELQAGLDAHKTEESLRRSGVDIDRVAWGIGQTELERRLKSKADTTGRMGTSGSGRVNSAQRQVLEFAAEHHASPDRVKWMSFRDASAKIGQLGDALGLTGKGTP